MKTGNRNGRVVSGGGLGDWGRSLRFCLQYWTRLPAKGAELHLQPADFRRSMVFLPFAGLLGGLFMAGLAFLGGLTSSMLVGAALAVVGGVAFTGGIYLDGPADLADAGAYRDRRNKMKSMSHKRVKWRGWLAIAAYMLMQTLLCYWMIDDLSTLELFLFLSAVSMVANYSVVLVAFFYHSLSVEDGGYRFIEGTRKCELLISTVYTLFALFFMLGWRNMLLVFVLAPLPCLPVTMVYNRKLQGINRDVLGLAHEMTAICAMLVMLVLGLDVWGLNLLPF